MGVVSEKVSVCKGCGARCGVEPAKTPGRFVVFHPDPLCGHWIAVMGGEGIGPVKRGKIDLTTGQFTLDEESKPS